MVKKHDLLQLFRLLFSDVSNLRFQDKASRLTANKVPPIRTAVTQEVDGSQIGFERPETLRVNRVLKVLVFNFHTFCGKNLLL
jgi:hypothetical protein